MKEKFFLAVFIVFALALNSCETFKGAAQGVKKDASNTCKNISQIGTNLKKADQKFQEKYW